MIGIDEVGRGAWAGPLLVVAARLKKGKSHPPGLNDSKKLTLKKRQQLFLLIFDAYDLGEGWVSADMIDSLGLSRALESAAILAVTHHDLLADEQIIIDGTVNFLRNTQLKNVKVQAKADSDAAIVSAASIAAKVMRDVVMNDIARNFPEYSFEKHVGYGTKAHRLAIDKHGLTRYHRRSFKPMKDM